MREGRRSHEVLVVDSSVALRRLGHDLRADLGDPDLIAPRLLWPEVTSALHEATLRGELEPWRASELFGFVGALPISPVDDGDLSEEAWRVADELGWAKTYDAEFVALSRLRGCRLVTLDARLRRGAARYGTVVGPDEL